MSVVSQFTPAAPVDAAAWFAHKLSFEPTARMSITPCSTANRTLCYCT